METPGQDQHGASMTNTEIQRCTPEVDRSSAEVIVGAVRRCCASDGEHLTDIQTMLTRASVKAFTGLDLHPSEIDVASPEQLATVMSGYERAFRERVLQLLSGVSLLLNPVPDDVIARVSEYGHAMDVGHLCEAALRRHHPTVDQAALYDFSRNGYADEFVELGDERVLHADGDDLGDGWAIVTDQGLANRWQDLADCAPGTLGNTVHQFYRARRFSAPGNGDGSTPPLLAQHDWVHVLANYGTAVECELEVFGFLAASDDDPRGFSLLAMVLGLFATGSVDHAATIFDADPGHLDSTAMATRLADAYRRGVCAHRPDGDRAGGLMATDWFEYADLPLEEARQRFGVPPKSPDAVAAGSAGVWDESGLSEYQMAHCDLPLIAEMRATS